MRHLLTLLFGFALASSGLHAQFDTTVVRVEDNAGNGEPGVRVLWYEDGTAYGRYLNNSLLQGAESRYTDANGNATFIYFTPSPTDTFYYATLDCQGGFEYGGYLFQNIPDTVTLTISCTPLPCQALTYVRYDSTGTVFATAAPMRSPQWVNNPPGSLLKEWTINGTVHNGYNAQFNPSPVTDSVVACYQGYANCSPQCDTLPPFQSNPSTPNCNAHFFVDTVNSLNFQGQLILGEDASASPGQVVAWEWDFGDGTVKNGQYPQHTYANYGVYHICLTITAVNGNDTCYSTYCDSVGIDSTGNLIYKNGFTVNVVDPATFGLPGQELGKAVSLYPNPTRSSAKITWPKALSVESIKVFSLRGELLENVSIKGAQYTLPQLSTGSYLIKLETDYGPVQRRLIVR